MKIFGTQLTLVVSVGGLIFLAIFFLLFTLYKVTALRYEFFQPNNSASGRVFVSGVDYSLPYPGMLPDNPLWVFKAMRDRVLISSSSGLTRAGLVLQVSDKRLVMGKELFDRKNYNLSLSTIAKGEKYLEEAFLVCKDAEVRGENIDGFLETLTKASLTHRQVLEEMMVVSPDDARPVINQAMDASRRVYTGVSILLEQKSKPYPPSKE